MQMKFRRMIKEMKKAKRMKNDSYIVIFSFVNKNQELDIIDAILKYIKLKK